MAKISRNRGWLNLAKYRWQIMAAAQWRNIA